MLWLGNDMRGAVALANHVESDFEADSGGVPARPSSPGRESSWRNRSGLPSVPMRMLKTYGTLCSCGCGKPGILRSSRAPDEWESSDERVPRMLAFGSKPKF